METSDQKIDWKEVLGEDYSEEWAERIEAVHRVVMGTASKQDRVLMRLFKEREDALIWGQPTRF